MHAMAMVMDAEKLSSGETIRVARAKSKVDVVVIDGGRDGRYRSRMSPDIKRVDAMLAEWGRWGMAALAFLGLPKEALISRVARFGFVGAAQGGPMPEPASYVLLTEQAVLKIQQIERSVIAEEYCQPWEPRERKARHVHMSCTRYSKVLERGRKSVRKELLALSYTFE